MIGPVGTREARARSDGASAHVPGVVEARALDAQARERRRIGRDLHDGTQQRLIVLLVRLSELVALIESDSERAVRLARRLESEAQAALDELRALIQGLQPPVLTDFGLVPALRAVSRSCPVPVTMITEAVHRYNGAIEDAVFFTCREAIQNTIKHAPSATAITLTLIGHDDRLAFAVEDDGPGYDAALPGSGTATMHQRIETLGGTLTITSLPAVGTRVSGSVPVSR